MIIKAIKDHMQLYVGYAVIALFIITAATAVWFWGESQRRAVKISNLQADAAIATGEIEKLKDSKRVQDETISTIRQTMAINDDLLVSLAETVDSLNVKDKTVLNRLSYLEKSNASVRAYLAARLPSDDSVRGCLLDDTCTDDGNQGGVSATAGKPADPVSSSGDGAKPDQR